MHYLFIIFSLLLTGSAKAATTIHPSPRTVIEGYFDDERSDTVTMTFYSQGLGNTSAGRIVQSVVTDHGHFLFTLPMEEKISYVSLSSFRKPVLFLYEYLIKKGDSVYIHINTSANKGEPRYTNGLHFSGKNCGAFKTRYHADSAYAELVTRVPHTTMSLDSINDNIKTLWTMYFSMLNQGLEEYRLPELQKFKQETDEDIYEILCADYRYNIENVKLVRFRYYWGNTFKHPDSLARRKIMADYFRNTIRHIDEKYPFTTKAKMFSKNYMDFACLRAELEATVPKNIHSINAALPLISIANKSPLAIREKLFTSLIAYLGGSQDLPGRDSLIRYAMQTIKDPFLLNVVNSYYERALKGRDAYDFRLEDVTGKPVTLSSFRGKTVVLDFWFTGCVGCIQVGKGLKPVKDQFKNDPSVVFISISTDKERSTWQKGLQSGLYTDDQEINLYTMGKGQGHDILKFYNITIYPRLMIIDPKGKLFAFNAERPGPPQGTLALIEQIRSASK